MNTKERKLAVAFLRDLSEVLGNRICNDWKFPSDWTLDERRAFVLEYHTWNGDPEEFDPNFLVLPDFAVASFLAHKINAEVAETD